MQGEPSTSNRRRWNMAEEGNALIEIDLAQFKLHVNIQDKISLSLHFDSESRRFYLAVIALVLHEMKKSGKIASIPLENHYDTLALLNETIGGKAGSSDRERLLPRIYMKWKDALPDLEHSPLFRVLGKKKEYDDAVGRTYEFTDEEKDAWANLFDYKGSHEHVRLRFSIDKLGATLDDVLITFADDANPSEDDGWDGFLKSLKQSTEENTEQTITHVDTAAPAVSSEIGRESWYRRRSVLALIIAVVAVAGTSAIWNFYLRPSPPQFEIASEERMAFPLPDKPSIAVLPFTNMSGDPEQEYLADGITEDIITTLSKVSNMFVIARHSVFIYKGKAVNVKQVAEELGVRYVLKGSVHRSGSRVRITAQLIDALTGHHLWAERYNLELKDIFALRDDITRKIVVELRVELEVGEQARMIASKTKSFEAWENYLKARRYWVNKKTQESNARGIQLIERAIELDPEFVNAYVLLGWKHFYDYRNGWSKSPAESLERSIELAQKAIAMDDASAGGHVQLGFLLMYKGKHEQAIIEGKRALALAPHSNDILALSAVILNYSGRPEEALPLILRAMRISPFYPPFYLSILSQAYFMTGQYEEALVAGKKNLERNPNYLYSNVRLVVIYSLLGRDEEARAQAAVLLKQKPKFSVQGWPKFVHYKNKVDLDRELNALRKAGLPE